MFWLVVPKLIREEKVKLIMTILLLIFLFQFLPKIYHCICLMRRMQKVTGYIFGTIWWGFALNLIAYFIASHVSLLNMHTTQWNDTKVGFLMDFFCVVTGSWGMLVCSSNTACCFLY